MCIIHLFHCFAQVVHCLYSLSHFFALLKLISQNLLLLLLIIRLIYIIIIEHHAIKIHINLFGGELILSNIGSIGKVFKVPYLDRPMTLASNTVMIKTATPELTDYLYYYFLSPAGYKSLLSISSGTSMLKFNKTELKKLEIPIPDIDKQRRIIAVMDKVSNLISLRKQQLAKLDELVKARFVEMFGDPVRNSMGLPTEPMTTVCAIIDGDRGKNYPKQDEFSDTGYCLFLNAKNVTATGFSFESRMFITKEKDNALHNGKLERGDVVLTTRGTLGNLAFYDDSVPFENVRINSGMVILRMNKSVMTEVFFIEQFKLQLQSIKGKIASGSAQPQLPISTMNKIRILLAPMTLQEQFATFVEQADKSKVAVQKALDEAQLLFDSLMQKYFE